MRVGLFVTCLADLMRPSIGFAALKLLEAAGCQITVPESQTCCGQPGYNSGDRKSAKALARKLLKEFADCDYLVVPSGSCGGMIRTHYPELFADEPQTLAQIQALSTKTFELTDFLTNVVKLQSVPGTLNATVTYHDACAGLREMHVKDQPRQLLGKMPGIKLQEMTEPETCCGFGGTFAVKYGEISTRLADNKCAHIETCSVDAIVLGDLGCMLNIEGRLRRRGNHTTQVLHIAEVLAGDLGDIGGA